MLMSVNDLHECRLADGAGGVTSYWLRTPTVYDPAKARRMLARQRVRRPSPHEFQVASLAGVLALAEAVGDQAEGERQKALLEQWYGLLVPLREEDIAEPDLEVRAAELTRLEGERAAAMQQIFSTVSAIEANLERHWPSYAELLADRNYWDDVSRIEIVRLLLVRIGHNGSPGGELPRDDEGLLTQTAYQALPAAHRVPLATFAFALLAPGETQRKN